MNNMGFFNPFGSSGSGGGGGGGSTANYNNLTNKPTINGVTVQGSLTTGDLLITAADVGALPSGTKYGADFALSIDSQTFIVTAQLKDQDGNNLGQAKTIDLPLETMVVGGSYDDTTQKVILTLKNGQTVEFSVADLISGLQSEITLSNKLDADLVSDVNSENKFVTTAEKATWNAKANASEVYTKSQTDSAIETAIGALDVSSVGGSGKYISAISETDGKISPIVETMDTVPTNGSTKAVTSGGVQAPLAEVVDNGAKNLVNINSPTSLSRFTVSGGVLTSQTGDSRANLTLVFKKLVGSNEVTINSFGEITESGVYSHTFQKSTENDTRFIVMHSGSTQDYKAYYDISALPLGDYVAEIYVSNYLKSNGGYTLQNLMVCTKATWGVSHQFEPYALPNPTLTSAAIKAVDEGAKNRAIENTFSNTGYYKQVRISPIITGDFVISIDNITSTDTNASKCAYVFIYTDGSTSSPTLMDRGTAYIQMIANTKEIAAINIYPSDTYMHSEGDTVSVTNLMICSVQDWAISQKYAPYALSNPTLTSALIEQVDAGAKNLLQFDVLGANTTDIGTSVVVNGVRFTMNSDKSVTVNRESSSSQSAYVWFRNSDGSAVYVTDFCDDVHVFSGAAGASVSTYTLFINNINGSGTYKYFGEGEIIGVSQVTPNAAGISISAGYSPSNLVIKPMICTAADYDVSPKFVPYRLSNAELTANILPSSYNAVEVETGAPISILSGGYVRIGNLVCINLKISVIGTISQSDPLVKGLPKPILEYNTGFGAVSLANNLGRVFNVIGVGSIAYGDAASISSGTVILSGMYIAQS